MRMIRISKKMHEENVGFCFLLLGTAWRLTWAITPHAMRRSSSCRPRQTRDAALPPQSPLGSGEGSACVNTTVSGSAEVISRSIRSNSACVADTVHCPGTSTST